MIEKLQNKNIDIATNIRTVFMVSYAVEAALLNATNFPPLKRPLENYIECDTVFYGYFENKVLAAVIEINQHNYSTHINSLVVAPNFFRKGIASKLIEFVFSFYTSNIFTVETGLKNEPATKLYKKLGFEEVKHYDTSHGITKVRFEKRRNK